MPIVPTTKNRPVEAPPTINLPSTPPIAGLLITTRDLIRNHYASGQFHTRRAADGWVGHCTLGALSAAGGTNRQRGKAARYLAGLEHLPFRFVPFLAKCATSEMSDRAGRGWRSRQAPPAVIAMFDNAISRALADGE